MKKILILGLFVFSFGLISCANNTAENKDDKAKVETTKPEAGKPEFLTYDSFIEKIWDFKANPNEFVYKGKEPAIIDFYADWCGPCKRIAPIMEKIAKDYEGKVKVYKINTDQQKELARVFNITSIPLVIFIPKEGDPMQQIGALPEAEYYKIVKEKLLGE